MNLGSLSEAPDPEGKVSWNRGDLHVVYGDGKLAVAVSLSGGDDHGDHVLVLIALGSWNRGEETLGDKSGRPLAHEQPPNGDLDGDRVEVGGGCCWVVGVHRRVEDVVQGWRREVGEREVPEVDGAVLVVRAVHVVHVEIDGHEVGHVDRRDDHGSYGGVLVDDLSTVGACVGLDLEVLGRSSQLVDCRRSTLPRCTEE